MKVSTFIYRVEEVVLAEIRGISQRHTHFFLHMSNLSNRKCLISASLLSPSPPEVASLLQQSQRANSSLVPSFCNRESTGVLGSQSSFYCEEMQALEL